MRKGAKLDKAGLDKKLAAAVKAGKLDKIKAIDYSRKLTIPTPMYFRNS